MNTEFTIHPKLHHYGIMTANLEAMITWYRKVLGMTPNHQSSIPEGAGRAPFSAFAFVSNDEMDHRIVFFETPGADARTSERRFAGLQHVAFAYDGLDDLLGTYVRLKKLGIEPTFAADHGLSISVYYDDPDGNVVELNAYNYSDPRTAAEHLRAAPPTRAHIDLDRVLTARKAGAEAWELHERALAGEFTPSKRFDPR
jgi:catechol 2,3-dioxygenase-like lactoylglutathione lyase family enzyme